MQTQTSDTLHNAIMEADSKDHPPMLASGNYVKWKSRIKRYIDTKPNHELIHHCLKNPPYKFTSQQAATRNKGKAIVNSPQPIYDEEPSMVAEDDETSKDKEIDKLMALISLSIGNVVGARETVGSTVVLKSRIQCYNCKEFGHVARECQKPKRAKDAAYHREKMLLCKQEEAGIQLNAEQADWRDDTNDELEDQELEAHYMYMAKLQEVSLDAADSGPIFDDEPLQKNDDDDADLVNERELLASLIEKLKCKIDESKNRNKFLETSNKVLIEKMKGEIEDFKNKNKSLESSNNHFKEANNKLSETNNLLYADFKKSQAKLARRNDVEYASKKEAQIKLYKTREDNKLDKVIALENKVKVLDNIVYKTGQSVQTINMLNNKCRTSFAKPEFLKKAQRANPCLYDIGVILTTSVSRPKLKSNLMGDSVMHNNSQGKKVDVEDHRRSVKFS
nr:Gag-Pol polyprotein [Tanacetum cinerariifolium]